MGWQAGAFVRPASDFEGPNLAWHSSCQEGVLVAPWRIGMNATERLMNVTLACRFEGRLGTAALRDGREKGAAMDLLDAPPRSDFARIAGAVTERAGELLQASVVVSDDRGQIVAGSDRSLVGRTSASLAAELPDHIVVAARLDGRPVEVLVCGRVATGEAIPARLAQALVDLVVNEVTWVDRFPDQQELKNKFIYDLLQGTSIDNGEVLRQAKLLSLDLTPPRAAILIDASDFILGRQADGGPEHSAEEISRRSRLVIGSVVGFFLLPDDTICAYSGDGEIAVLKASDSKNLATWVDTVDDPEPSNPSWANLSALKRAASALVTRLRHDTGRDVRIGIGRYHPGIPGLARSYQDARAALALGRQFGGDERVLCLDGLGIAAFVGVADEQTKVELARHLLSPLDHEPELIETVRVFFADDCCPSIAAGRLGIHRNTLGYRLEKIASLTGLDPRRFDDAVQIRLALVLRSLGEAPH